MRYYAMLACVMIAGACFAQEPAAPVASGTAETTNVIHLFNGKDLGGWYTYLKGRGRDVDPLKVFTVSDGMLRISGEELGCVTSVNEFENYRLIMEFKWGELTHAGRKDKARDSGLLVHSVGEDGAYGGIWMYSIECQMIEGGTGDILVVGDGSENFKATCPVAPEKSGECYVFQPDGKPATINAGRVNWFGRDPDWKDAIGFRGRQDVEKPLGEWNRYECIAEGNTLTVLLNGIVVNKCLEVQPHKGRIQIQSEGAELFVRCVDLIPLDSDNAGVSASQH
ncbi:MAG: hypothetical protein BWY09_00207 [Candidatus Hydrogenedentes bacterium ADurb.Bin179]|nr:MAG: hypothetical protein BWY09_00207 [Candidatus Hydrogenedentes bacterium ADurb.Bin179]